MERGMDLARRMYSREWKVAAMREIDSGRTISEVARQLELSPKLLERWRSEWRARGELAFPGNGRQGVSRAFGEPQRIAQLERKIGQLTMGNDFLKKPASISGSITRRPSSVARLFVGTNPASGRERARASREGAVPDDGAEPGRLLPLACAAARRSGRDGVARHDATDRTLVPRLWLPSHHGGAEPTRFPGEP